MSKCIRSTRRSVLSFCPLEDRTTPTATTTDPVIPPPDNPEAIVDPTPPSDFPESHECAAPPNPPKPPRTIAQVNKEIAQQRAISATAKTAMQDAMNQQKNVDVSLKQERQHRDDLIQQYKAANPAAKPAIKQQIQISFQVIDDLVKESANLASKVSSESAKWVVAETKIVQLEKEAKDLKQKGNGGGNPQPGGGCASGKDDGETSIFVAQEDEGSVHLADVIAEGTANTAAAEELAQEHHSVYEESLPLLASIDCFGGDPLPDSSNV